MYKYGNVDIRDLAELAGAKVFPQHKSILILIAASLEMQSCNPLSDFSEIN